jgi:hypothetical protein
MALGFNYDAYNTAYGSDSFYDRLRSRRGGYTDQRVSNVVNNLNKALGTDKKKLKDFTKRQFAKAQFLGHAPNKSAENQQQYFDALSAKFGEGTVDERLANLSAQETFGNFTPEQTEDIRAALLAEKYEKGFDQDQFDTLLGKLTASKIRQGRAAGIQDRAGTYAEGLANMMRNF